MEGGSDERGSAATKPRSREWKVALMSAVLPILLFALAGVLVGGAWSMHRQGATRGVVGFVGVLALLATAGGVLWLMPGDS
jgi:hypothetical protein